MYAPYLSLSQHDLFIKWPDVESMPPADYEAYNSTDMMGAVSLM